ncbi:DUF732 domain-containing protein [Mycobacterium sp. 1245852.3]|uniref:DUF732 domain-containing protein n=1 Tax=Mycobacterium sp. 1245852.3 TaxID=1856860 RepID=UPI0007FC17D1|nr:DUF732 domain-containing protein [Mycobacterium sp. 1245852.3]OBJ81084.1 hypothetical protein A9W96_29510 [Mycobacterium sp. 1245852.3]
MTDHTPSRRGRTWLTGGVTTTIAAAAAVFAASGVAHADENSYLSMLDAASNGRTHNADDHKTALNIGYTICDALAGGVSEPQAAQIVVQTNPEVPLDQARMLVRAAHSQLCPGA